MFFEKKVKLKNNNNIYKAYKADKLITYFKKKFINKTNLDNLESLINIIKK